MERETERDTERERDTHRERERERERERQTERGRDRERQRVMRCSASPQQVDEFVEVASDLPFDLLRVLREVRLVGGLHETTRVPRLAAAEGHVVT